MAAREEVEPAQLKAELPLDMGVTIAKKKVQPDQEEEKTLFYGKGAAGELHMHQMLLLVLQNALSLYT